MEHLSTKEKIKDMNRQEKAKYIWCYYKIHIISSIVIIILIASFISQVKSTKTPMLNVIILGTHADLNKVQVLEDKATKELIKDNKNKYKISINFMTRNDDPKDQYNFANIQKLTAMIASRDVDILIVDKKDFENYCKQDAAIKVPDDLSKKFNSTAYGIDAKDIQALKNLGYDTNDKVLFFVSNSQRLDKAYEFTDWLFKQQ